MMNFPMGQIPVPAPVQKMMGQMSSQSNQNVPVNQSQFKQFLPMLNDNMLNQLIAQARQQGISELDIQNGLNFINSMR